MWANFVTVHSIAGSSNGRTSPFGGEYLGSNPSPAARVSAVSWQDHLASATPDFLPFHPCHTG